MAAAYQYEADHHCTTCADKRFGLWTLEHGEAVDSEGNAVQELRMPDLISYLRGQEDHNWDHGPKVDACGTCGTLLAYQTDPDDHVEGDDGVKLTQVYLDWGRARVEHTNNAAAESIERATEHAVTSLLDDGLDALADVSRGLLDLDEVAARLGAAADHAQASAWDSLHEEATA